MTISQKMDPDLISIDRSIRSKKDALWCIAKTVKKNRTLKTSEDDIFGALLDRENLSSTGFGNGIAVPHCSLENIEDFIIGLLVIPDGIDFDAIDKRKVKILAFIIAPKHRRDEHVKYLSQFSRLLKQDAMIESIAGASTAIEIKEQLDDFFARTEQHPVEGAKDYVLFHIILQQHDLLPEIIQLLSEVSYTFLSVIEAENAGNYLYSMPLFASFWDETQKGYNKIILAAVPKKLANDVLRRLNTVTHEKPGEGMLVMTQDINYLNGSINI